MYLYEEKENTKLKKFIAALQKQRYESNKSIHQQMNRWRIYGTYTMEYYSGVKKD